MKIMFLVPSGAQRSQAQFRVLPYVERGRQLGLDISWKAVPQSFYGRYAFFSQLPMVDTFVVHRELFSTYELSLLKRLCTTLIFDCADAVWTLPDIELRKSWLSRFVTGPLRRFERICRDSDMCIVDNRTLADAVSSYQDAIRIVPTPIDCTAYSPGNGGNLGGAVLVGWLGSEADMESVNAALGQLEAYAGPIQFSIVSDTQYNGPASEYVIWSSRSSNKEISQLQAMDIGLSPLPNDAFMRAGNGLDVLRFMACGVAVVASDIGGNAEIIDHGIDGFLVREEADWGRYVMRLVEDVSLRQKMVEAAREKVISKYSLDVITNQFWDALEI